MERVVHSQTSRVQPWLSHLRELGQSPTADLFSIFCRLSFLSILAIAVVDRIKILQWSIIHNLLIIVTPYQYQGISYHPQCVFCLTAFKLKQRRHESCSLTVISRGIYRWPEDSHHGTEPVMRRRFDVMTSSCEHKNVHGGIYWNRMCFPISIFKHRGSHRSCVILLPKQKMMNHNSIDIGR